MAAVVTVNDVLDGHVSLDVECLDRIYLNGYVPNLQVGGQVVSFLTAHLGYPIPSPAIMEKIGTAFRRAVASFAEADRRVTCYYFYLWDDDFGPAFVKVCAYFPYPMKIWVNGHEWAKRQATKTGIGFTELSNGFATCSDPVGLQAICDRLGPGVIRVFAERWWSILPLPLTEHDRAAGYWWELSMRQVETSRTLVFDEPRHARGFFEALVTDNLDIGRPELIELISNAANTAAPKQLASSRPKSPPTAPRSASTPSTDTQ